LRFKERKVGVSTHRSISQCFYLKKLKVLVPNIFNFYLIRNIRNLHIIDLLKNAGLPKVEGFLRYIYRDFTVVPKSQAASRSPAQSTAQHSTQHSTLTQHSKPPARKRERKDLKKGKKGMREK
jgi:hypothetical protein